MDVEQNAGDRGDLEIQQYALYGLATTYLMQNENSSAQARYEQINPDAPDEIRFSVLYNSGIIEHRKLLGGGRIFQAGAPDKKQRRGRKNQP